MTYWIALALFGIAILVPEFIIGDWWLFREDEIESVILLLLVGGLFLTYLLTDRRLRVMRNVNRELQQEVRNSDKDLSTAYEHIGETNRKIEIVLGFHTRMMNGTHVTYSAMCRDLSRRIGMIARITGHVYILDCAAGCVVGMSDDAPTPSPAARAALCASRPARMVALGADGSMYRLIGARHTNANRVIAVLCDIADRANGQQDNIDDELVRMITAIAATELEHGTISADDED